MINPTVYVFEMDWVIQRKLFGFFVLHGMVCSFWTFTIDILGAHIYTCRCCTPTVVLGMGLLLQGVIAALFTNQPLQNENKNLKI